MCSSWHALQGKGTVLLRILVSSMSGSGAKPSTPQFEEAVKQEVELLSRQYPTPDDIPGCLKLFDNAIVCNSTVFFLPPPLTPPPQKSHTHIYTHNGSIRCFIYLILTLIFIAASSQIRSLYRYGHMAECTPAWSDFKFCLSLRALSAEERRVAWIRHRAEWWATRRTMMGSSEDVWEVRKYVNVMLCPAMSLYLLVCSPSRLRPSPPLPSTPISVQPPLFWENPWVMDVGY